MNQPRLEKLREIRETLDAAADALNTSQAGPALGLALIAMAKLVDMAMRNEL